MGWLEQNISSGGKYLLGKVRQTHKTAAPRSTLFVIS
jgi:hypothetical protein